MRYFSTVSIGILALALAACGDSPVQPELRAEPSGAGRVITSALSVTYLYCEDTGGGGIYYNNTFCEAQVSGGAGGYTYDWDVIETSRSDWSNGSLITGVCTDSYPVTFTVRDAAGAVASAHQTFRCYASSYGGGGIDP